MIKKIKNILLFLFITIFIFSCKEDKTIVISPEDYHATVDKVVEIMIHDIFSPPVASRVFAYTNIAAYEIVSSNNKTYKSLSGQLTELTKIRPYTNVKEGLNKEMAALVAYIEVAKELVFSEELITEFRDSLYAEWQQKNPNELKKAKSYGLEVANHIKLWISKDHYSETRSMSKHVVVNNTNPSIWQPTPPNYMDGIEPHWNKIRTFVIKTADQFKPIPPPEFSMEKQSAFYKQLKEVYDTGLEISKKGDNSEEIKIAQFWDCNPYVSVTRGHLMFAVKKITPGAHWIGITKIASRKDNYNFNQTVYAYTKTSLAIADAFISCWDEKYRSNLVRPETLINKYIDESWKPILQTPPFPEYTSGHSVVSGAASTVLTNIFGDNFSFNDDTEVQFDLPVRKFNSFNEAADEAAISRLYGGIHYKAAIMVGVEQGRNIGNYLIQNIKMKE